MGLQGWIYGGLAVLLIGRWDPDNGVVSREILGGKGLQSVIG